MLMSQRRRASALSSALALAANPCFVAEDYVWLDRQGRPTSPPALGQGVTEGTALRKVTIELSASDNLGLMIRGGNEYGLGIYITGVEDQSVASRCGLEAGDEILDVNGHDFRQLNHDEAVRVLKYSHRLCMTLLDVGKVPHSAPVAASVSATGDRGSRTSSGSAASTVASMWEPRNNNNNLLNDEDEDDEAAVVAAEVQAEEEEYAKAKSDWFSEAASASTALRRSASKQYYEARYRNSDPNTGSPRNNIVRNNIRSPSCSSSPGRRRSSSHSLRSMPPSSSVAVATAARALKFECADDPVVDEDDDEDEDASSPELSMVLGKAKVLLSHKEFTALRVLLDEYSSAAMDGASLAREIRIMFANGQKSSFFTELREIVRSEDLAAFDEVAFKSVSSSTLVPMPLVGSKDMLFPLEWDEWAARHGHEDRQRSPSDGQPPPLAPPVPSRQQRHSINVVGVDQRNLAEMLFKTNGVVDNEEAFDRFPPHRNQNALEPFRTRACSLQQMQQQQQQQQQLQQQQQHQQYFQQQHQHPDNEGDTSLLYRPPPQSRVSSTADGGPRLVRVRKVRPSLGMAMEGGSNTQQPWPRIIAIQQDGAAYVEGGLKVGQLIKEVDGMSVAGLPHESVAKIIAEAYAKKNRSEISFVVIEAKKSAAENRRACLLPNM